MNKPINKLNINNELNPIRIKIKTISRTENIRPTAV
jgi:hypothetical protein